jgi:hypothetical protein
MGDSLTNTQSPTAELGSPRPCIDQRLVKESHRSMLLGIGTKSKSVMAVPKLKGGN